MEDRKFTFEQIVGSDIKIVSVPDEEFGSADSYLWLWQQMKQLPNVSFDFDSWTDNTIDGASPIIQLSVKGTTWILGLSNNMGFFDFNFVEKLNKIIETLNLSENRFRSISPEGVENNYGEVNIVFLHKDIVRQLDDNGYGLGDAKWFGL